MLREAAESSNILLEVVLYRLLELFLGGGGDGHGSLWQG